MLKLNRPIEFKHLLIDYIRTARDNSPMGRTSKAHPVQNRKHLELSHLSVES